MRMHELDNLQSSTQLYHFITGMISSNVGRFWESVKLLLAVMEDFHSDMKILVQKIRNQLMIGMMNATV